MKTWQDRVKLAKSYLAVGQIDQYISEADGEPPWHLATSCEPGGSHRLEISTTVRFCGRHPSGLNFRWTFDIEPQAANGSGSYHINVEGCRRVLAELPPRCRTEFKKYLWDCAVAVRKKAEDWDKVTRRQFADAEALERAAI